MRALCLSLLIACGEPVAIEVFTHSAITAADVKSYQLWVFSPTDRDGLPLACEDLLARRVLPGSPNVIKLREPQEGNFTDGAFNVDAIPVGSGTVIFYIDLFDQPGLIGNRIGYGCRDVLLRRESTIDVTLEVQAP